jgi:hypothetical protein
MMEIAKVEEIMGSSYLNFRTNSEIAKPSFYITAKQGNCCRHEIKKERKKGILTEELVKEYV